MRPGSASAALAAAVAALTLLAAPAAGRHRRLPPQEQLQATGAITYTWHGDPARGCAAVSLCNARGAIVISHLVPSLVSGYLALGSSGTARVSDGGAGECVDVLGGADSLQIARRGSRLQAAFFPGSLTGRCAEPLSQELTAIALPVRLRGSRHRPTLDLRARRRFAAGPFSGTLDSTLVLRPLSPPATGFFSASSSISSHGSGSRSAPTHPVLAEFVNLTVAVRPEPSALDYQLAGEADPLCRPLDSCQTSGSLALSVSGELRLTLSAVRRVHRRVSARRALSDFRRGRLPFSFPTFGQLRATTEESLVLGDGSRCQDRGGGELQLVVGALSPFEPNVGTRDGLPVALTALGQPANLLRTHCPGPLDADLLGAGQNLVYGSGRLAASALLSRRTTVSVVDPGAFAGPGYTGSRGGAIKLGLTVISLHAGTEGTR